MIFSVVRVSSSDAILSAATPSKYAATFQFLAQTNQPQNISDLLYTPTLGNGASPSSACQLFRQIARWQRAQKFARCFMTAVLPAERARTNGTPHLQASRADICAPYQLITLPSSLFQRPTAIWHPSLHWDGVFSVVDPSILINAVPCIMFSLQSERPNTGQVFFTLIRNILWTDLLNGDLEATQSLKASYRHRRNKKAR